jgi:hypothetical protein
MICPACGQQLTLRRSGPMLRDDRTGLLARVVLVRCEACKRNGKALVTADVQLYDAPNLEHTT